MTTFHTYDAVIVGAGGAGLRAAIEARGIPVEVVGLGGLLTVPEVADVVATLRVLHDPTASGSLARLLTGPRWRIGPRDLVALGRRASDLAREHRNPEPPSPGQASQGQASQGQASTGQASAGVPERPRDSVRNDDALAQAVTDLTAEQGSLVEALDDLGPAGAYSARGHARFGALAAEPVGPEPIGNNPGLVRRSRQDHAHGGGRADSERDAGRTDRTAAGEEIENVGVV